MKRKLSAVLAVFAAVSIFLTTAYASSNYQSGDVPIGSSNEVLMKIAADQCPDGTESV